MFPPKHSIDAYDRVCKPRGEPLLEVKDIGPFVNPDLMALLFLRMSRLPATHTLLRR